MLKILRLWFLEPQETPFAQESRNPLLIFSVCLSLLQDFESLPYIDPSSFPFSCLLEVASFAKQKYCKERSMKKKPVVPVSERESTTLMAKQKPFMVTHEPLGSERKTNVKRSCHCHNQTQFKKLKTHHEKIIISSLSEIIQEPSTSIDSSRFTVEELV